GLVAGAGRRRDRLAGAVRAGRLVRRALVARSRPRDPLATAHAAVPRGAGAGRRHDEHRARPARFVGPPPVSSSSTGTAALVEVAPAEGDPLLARLGRRDADLLPGYRQSARLVEANDLHHQA